MKNARLGSASLVSFGCAALCTILSGSILAQKSSAGQPHTQNITSAREWETLETLLGGIHGLSTAPPANLITAKYTSGALMGNGDIGVVAGDELASQQSFWFGKSDFWGTHWNARHNAPEVSILSLGHMTISSPVKAVGGETEYHVDQDILHAHVDTTLRMADATVHLRSWTADSENTFVTEIRSSGAEATLTLTLGMPAPDAASHTSFPTAAGSRNQALWVTRENNLTGKNEYKAKVAIAVRLLGAQAGNVTSSASSVSANFTIKPGAPVWILAAFESDARMNLDGPPSAQLADKALHHVAEMTPARVNTLEREHLEWWKNFWTRSYIEVHDKVLEEYYYGALYVLGSSSRPGKLPPSLWGNFITTDNAGWGGRYFMNYNEEAPFYGVFSSNRAELAEPYNRMVLAQMPWQRNRTAAAGYRGISFQRTFSPFTVIADPPGLTPVASIKDWKKLPSDQKSNATFSLLPVIQYYEYTRDDAFLKTKLYPAMKELDEFWRDFAVRDATGKKWVFEHSSAHEGGDDVNPNLDIGFAQRIERELIEMSKVLDVDSEMRSVWQSFIDQLSPYPTGTVNDKVVYYIAAAVKNEIKNQGLFEPGDQPINLEGLVYPGENLAIGGDAAQLEIARNSMLEMNSWGVTKGGNTNNGFCKIFPIAARIGWPADDLTAKFKAAILHQWRPSNLTVFQGGGGIETSGSIEALNSMLLQHEDGVMRVFPDWPASMDASFTRLRAKGAFLVSSEQRSGAVVAIDIRSEKGGSLKLQSPWGKDAVVISGVVSPLKPDAQGRIALTTKAGALYHLTAAH
jgi:hypothetical protein